MAFFKRISLSVLGGKPIDFQPKYPPSTAKKRKRCCFHSHQKKKSQEEILVDLDCCVQSHRYKKCKQPTLVGCATKVFVEKKLSIGPVIDKGDPTLPKKYKKDNLMNFKADVISYPNRTASLIGHAEQVEHQGTATNKENKSFT